MGCAESLVMRPLEQASAPFVLRRCGDLCFWQTGAWILVLQPCVIRYPFWLAVVNDKPCELEFLTSTVRTLMPETFVQVGRFLVLSPNSTTFYCLVRHGAPLDFLSEFSSRLTAGRYTMSLDWVSTWEVPYLASLHPSRPQTCPRLL